MTKFFLYIFALLTIIAVSGCLSDADILKIQGADKNPQGVQDVNEFQFRVKALINQDLATCDLIKTPARKNSCYTEVAKLKQDITFCDKLVPSEAQTTCKTEVTAYLQNKSDLEQIEIARAKLDTTLCDIVVSPQIKSDCLLIVENAKSIHDQNVTTFADCESLGSQAKRDQCYTDYAYKSKDPGICINVPPGQDRDNCYSAVAWFAEDMTICEKTSSELNRSNCIFEIAVKTNNFTQEICDKIKNVDEYNKSHDACIRRITPA